MSLSPCRRCGTAIVACVYRKGPTVNRGVTRLGWMVECPACGYSTHARANPRTACAEWDGCRSAKTERDQHAHK